MQFTNRRNQQVWIITGSTFCTLLCTVATFFPALTRGAAGRVAQVEAPTDAEALPGLPAPVRLSWEEISTEGLSETYGGSTVALRLENLTADVQQVRLRFVADDGGLNTETRKREAFTVPPHATVAQPVDVGEFGFDPMRLPYAGYIQAVARIAPDSDPQAKARYQQVEAPALYFHPVKTGNGRGFAFYGERALGGKFAGGNFRLGRSGLRDVPGEITTRVKVGGAGIEAATANSTIEIDEPDTEGHAAQTNSLRQPAISQTTTLNALAAGQSYRACIKFQIRTVDSSIPIPTGANAGGTEDHYLGANDDISVIARGVRVKLSRAGWEHTYDADSGGCFNWSHEATSGFTLRVYGYATDDNGNYVRIHNAPSSFASYPGATYSAVLNNVTPTPNGTNTYEVGDYTGRWTAMAALAFGLYRYHDGLSDKAFHVGIDDTRPDGASAHFDSANQPCQGDVCPSNASITSGRHYLRLGNANVDSDGNPATPRTRYKFHIAHELGHAIAALYYGDHEDAVNGGEPNVRSDHNVSPNACGFSTSYSISSKEWNSIGFREGFAHFIAARIWNNKETEGAFTWFAAPHDLERYNQGANNSPGGRLENVCCVGGNCADSWADAGTNEDWLRFFWDWYTFSSNSCNVELTRLDMLKLYRQTRLNGGLTKNNYFSKMRAAAQDIGLEGCVATGQFDYYAAHNGIDNE